MAIKRGPRKKAPPEAQAVITLTEKQGKCLASSASITIFGGGNGGGKTQALMYAAMQHMDVAGYDAALFMESAEKVKMPGGLLDRSEEALRAPDPRRVGRPEPHR